MTRKNIKLCISYDGSNYHGWQTQREGIVTIQTTMEEIMSKILGHRVKLRTSGRTDTGVHAVGQVVNFFSETPIPAEKLQRIINNYLPEDIRIWKSQEVEDSFDANTSAISKLYRYSVYNRNIRTPHRGMPDVFKTAHVLPVACDIEPMRIAAMDFVGEHDFRSFAAAICSKKSTIRTVLRCDITRENHMIYFDVEGTGFLHNMVRNMVGMLLDIGRGKKPVDCIPEIMAARNRSVAGSRGPACGLCLQWVKYKKHWGLPPYSARVYPAKADPWES